MGDQTDHPNVGPDTTSSVGSRVPWVTDLRWRLILSLGAIQVLPASIALFNLYPQWIELLIGIVLGLVWVAVLRLRRVDRPFVSGLFVGLTAGVVTAAVQGPFVRVYLRHHPDLLQTNPDASVVTWAASIVGVSLLGGLVAGLITGTLAWLIGGIGRPDVPGPGSRVAGAWRR